MRDSIGTICVLAAMTACHLYACDDGTRDRRPFDTISTGSGAGGEEVDPCDPLPDTCEVGDQCGCWGGEPGKVPFRGTTSCSVDEVWTECAQ